MDILKILRERQSKSQSRLERENYQKLLNMYKNGVEYDDFALIDEDILAIYPKSLIPQTLAKARILTKNPKLTLEQLLAYRPKRTYKQQDMTFNPKSIINFIQKPINTPIVCDICGAADTYSTVRGRLCINCFCRETFQLIDAYKQKGKMLKFDDARLWVNKQIFPKDELFELATVLHAKLRHRQIWDAIADAFEKKNINIGRWTRY